LADQLKDRQQFLDLLRYVFDLRDRSANDASQHFAGMGEVTKQRELSESLHGRMLIGELNCEACHRTEMGALPYPTKPAPNLRWSAQNLNPDYLARFIARPHELKPGTSMPSLLHSLGEDGRESAAKAIVHFLISSVVGQESSIASDQKPDRESERDASTLAITDGNGLFHSVGCVACHSPRGDDASEQPISDSIPLGDLGEKYTANALIDFLENPHAVRPGGRMPNMQLSHREAINLASYLLQKQDSQSAALEVDPALALEGERHFRAFRCGNCHTSVLEETSAQPIIAIRTGSEQLAGCLSSTSASSPKFDLDNRERKAIQSALEMPPHPLTADEKIDVTLTAFNCVACHSRDGLGGVSVTRSPHFQTTNQNLGEQGRVPPTLSGVGAKLKPKWTRDVLVAGRSIRPYMKTRMPQFGEKNIGHLVQLFDECDQLPEVPKAEFDDQKAIRELGENIVGNQGLNCVACHTYQYKIADTMPAVDLTEMAERLQKEWFYQYMFDPQRFSPNTVMPSFWPGGKAMRTDLEGDPSYQVEAIWQYLLDGRQARAPRGVIREPLEIVVGDEARMLRRRYPGMGKRGIGVGYPGGVNLSFDAEQMRLASLWRGRFVDPSGVWYGQGHGVVRPLGRTIDLQTGPDLDLTDNPWEVDEGRPPNHQFGGYRLGEKRRPTLFYSVGSVNVQDYFAEFRDDAGQAQLRRVITLSAGGDAEHLTFRVVSAESVERLDERGYRVGERLTVRITSESAPVLTKQNDLQQVTIPLALTALQTQTVVVDYLW
jgi:mono/diheme cytochrome c family protein